LNRKEEEKRKNEIQRKDMPKKYYFGSRKHLVNLGYTHTSINKQLIKEERIKQNHCPDHLIL